MVTSRNSYYINRFLWLLLALLPILIIPFKGLPSIFISIKAPVLTILCIVILVFIIREKVKLRELEFKLLLLYLTFVFLACVFAHKPLLAFSGVSDSAGRFEGFITLCFYAVIFVAAKNHLVVNRKNVIFYLTVQSLVACYSVAQYYGIDPLVEYLNFRKGNYSTIGNENFFGSYVVTLLTLTSGLFVFDKRPQTLVLCSLFFAGLLASNTRGCWIAFALIMVLSLFLLSKKRFIKPYFILLITFSLITLTMNFTRQNHILGRAKSIEQQVSVDEGSGSGRMQIWKMTTQAVLENPFFGTGPENLKEHFIQTKNKGFLAYKNRTGKTVDKAHNEILHITSVSGIPAAIAYIFFIMSIYWKNRKELFRINPSTLLMMTVTVYLIQALFNISVIAVAPLFWALMGVFASQGVRSSNFYSNSDTLSPS